MSKIAAIFSDAGSYLLLMKRVFKVPTKKRYFIKQYLFEINSLGIESIPIVLFLSVFMGAVVCIQMLYNVESPIIPKTMIGYATLQSIILEFSPTIISLILAGKIGSRVASEIGSMKVTEQVDALDVMGVNSANFLILPKVMAAVSFFPVLTVFSIFAATIGGGLVSITGLITLPNYIDGIRIDFRTFIVFYALIKSVVFAFIITTVSAYKGYSIKGGALEVGTASTNAVVQSSILIIIFNLVLTQLLLA